jgi:hypothetical protein
VGLPATFGQSLFSVTQTGHRYRDILGRQYPSFTEPPECFLVLNRVSKYWRRQLIRSRLIETAFTLFVLGTVAAEPAALSQSTPLSTAITTQSPHDGQHDFDFHVGAWETHIKRLVNPLSNSTTWVELNGTVMVRKILDGRANIEEIDASNDTMHLQGLTLFLYNPASHQWSQRFANINDGNLSEPPLMGEFKDGRGEFYCQDTFKGRSILVRFVWSDITQDSHHVEQSFSVDGGRTWEPNFIANLKRLVK